ncbi:hypothetical protein BDY24DRAFT_129657 [Mrakia frigida]|uniref:uncharacterized protein n=1 Tax=Mrakia frigida TaxID=29902 RepID=UPI003FCBF665
MTNRTLHVIDGFELARNLHHAAPVAFNALVLNPIPFGSAKSLTLPTRRETPSKPTIVLSPLSARLQQLRRNIPLYRDSPPVATPEITSINFAPSFQRILPLNDDVNKTLQGLRWMMLEAAQALDVEEDKQGSGVVTQTNWGVERTRKVKVELTPGDAFIFRRDRFLVGEEPPAKMGDWGLARWFCNLKKPLAREGEGEEVQQKE